MPVGTRNLNRVPNSSVTASPGVFPIIKPTTWYYQMFLTNSLVGLQETPMISYVIADNASRSIYNSFGLTSCSKYDDYRIHFLNKLGGFDSFTFNKLSRINEDIERKQYKKIYGSTTGRWSINTYERGAINYNTSIKDKITLNSDWITEAEATWLEQLVASPEIYWDNNDELWAINITNTSYEKRKTVNDKIFNLIIDIEISQKRFTQRF